MPAHKTHVNVTEDHALRQFPLLDEGPAVFPTWLRLVSGGIRGKRAHDARLSSVALANGVSRILILNVADVSGVGGWLRCTYEI